jgi:hypothetical protein
MTALWASFATTTKPVYAYCFAKPRVGNQAYADCVDENVAAMFRITNFSDIVPQVIP